MAQTQSNSGVWSFFCFSKWIPRLVSVCPSAKLHPHLSLENVLLISLICGSSIDWIIIIGFLRMYLIENHCVRVDMNIEHITFRSRGGGCCFHGMQKFPNQGSDFHCSSGNAKSLTTRPQRNSWKLCSNWENMPLLFQFCSWHGWFLWQKSFLWTEP